MHIVPFGYVGEFTPQLSVFSGQVNWVRIEAIRAVIWSWKRTIGLWSIVLETRVVFSSIKPMHICSLLES